jgi:ATP adenylyltransferase
MDRLWAPWRMGYILSNSKKQTGCFLCEAVKQNDDRKTYILYHGKHSYVIMNLYPYNNGHLLIAPYAHVPDMNRLSLEDLTDLMKCTQESINILQQDMKPEGFNLGINIGKAAGAGLPEHMHIQIVPRWTGDTSSITIFDNTRVMPELLDETYERLRPYFERLKENT